MPAKLLSAVAVSLVLGVTVSAQGTFTSPNDTARTEGRGEHAHILGSSDRLRWQQLDPTVVGRSPTNIRSIAWRRDGLRATNQNFGARVFRGMQVIMAHTKASAASTNYDGNYLRPATRVFGPRDVSAPDWTTKPRTAPPAFDLRVLFDRPWTYNGTDDLLWEVRVVSTVPTPTTITSYPYDLHRLGASAMVQRVYQWSAFQALNRIDGTNYGRGCLAGGSTFSRFTLTSSMENSEAAGTLTLELRLARGAGRVPAVVLVGAQRLDQPLSGLCSNLYVGPTIQLPLGTTSPNGDVPRRELSLPYNPSLFGQTVYLQGACVDLGQPGLSVAVTQGEEQRIPDAQRKLYHSGPYGGGVVTQFGF